MRIPYDSSSRMVPLLITDLEEACFGRIEPGTHVPRHLHHFFQLDVILEGATSVTLEAHSKLHCRRGDCILIPPLLRHGYETKAGFRQMTFKFHLAAKFWTLFSRAVPCVGLPRPLLDGLELVVQKLSGDEALDASRALAVLTLCLGEISEFSSGVTEGPDIADPLREKLWPLLERVVREPFRRWTVDEMARHCHMQADHFTRCFRKVLEKTPRAFLLETRIRAGAALLLSDNNPTIEVVAETCGYSSPHAFTRAFTKTMGLGPAAYRRSPTEFSMSDSVKSLSFRGKDNREGS